MNSIKCFIFGHKKTIAQCPYTKATLVSCDRCGLGKSNPHGSMSFN